VHWPAPERALGINIEPGQSGGDDLGRSVGPVTHSAAEHCGYKKAGSIVYGANHRQVTVMVKADPVPAKPLEQHLFHLPFGLDAFGWVKKEIFVKHNARMRVPPRRVQNKLDRQQPGFKQRISGVESHYFGCRIMD